jgi:hypothetical protein
MRIDSSDWLVPQVRVRSLNANLGTKDRSQLKAFNWPLATGNCTYAESHSLYAYR